MATKKEIMAQLLRGGGLERRGALAAVQQGDDCEVRREDARGRHRC
ncbi:MAG: hypothetical protein KH040_01655 [Collinsella sp.]|nr:hypothetical protein [Collinsella sp.]